MNYYLGANPIDDIAEVVQSLRKDTTGRLDKYKNILESEKDRLKQIVDLKTKQKESSTSYIPYVLGAVAVVGAAYFLSQRKK